MRSIVTGALRRIVVHVPDSESPECRNWIDVTVTLNDETVSGETERSAAGLPCGAPNRPGLIRWICIATSPAASRLRVSEQAPTARARVIAAMPRAMCFFMMPPGFVGAAPVAARL